ncbi:MAG: hypothetical protein U5R31_10265 [Acidimicrobiia bacterium]|nr:hypothetical protein [Acidimicrobiia bacterium]
MSDRVDAASDLAVETFSRPMIRAMSVGSGTARAARRLRRRDRRDDTAAEPGAEPPRPPPARRS